MKGFNNFISRYLLSSLLEITRPRCLPHSIKCCTFMSSGFSMITGDVCKWTNRNFSFHRHPPGKAGCFSPKTPKSAKRRSVRGFFRRLSGGKEQVRQLCYLKPKCLQLGLEVFANPVPHNQITKGCGVSHGVYAVWHIKVPLPPSVDE